MPVPGFLETSMSASILSPFWIARRGARLRRNIARICASSTATASLSTGLASIVARASAKFADCPELVDKQ